MLPVLQQQHHHQQQQQRQHQRQQQHQLVADIEVMHEDYLVICSRARSRHLAGCSLNIFWLSAGRLLLSAFC